VVTGVSLRDLDFPAGRASWLDWWASRQRTEIRVVRRVGASDISSGYGIRVYARDGRVTEVWLSGSGMWGWTTLRLEQV
jgi:hypothetical protein